MDREFVSLTAIRSFSDAKQPNLPKNLRGSASRETQPAMRWHGPACPHTIRPISSGGNAAKLRACSKLRAEPHIKPT